MLLSIVIITSSLFYFLYKIRYEFSYFPLYLITKLQGHRFRLARQFDEIKEALMLTDKGRGIEELIATPAWLPIKSLESVNGSEWIQLKKNFLILQKHLPSVQLLGVVAKHEMEKVVSKYQELNSKDISILTLKIFVNWMFNKTDTFSDVLTEEQLERMFNSSIEYRKEIAFKGVGDKIKKQESVNIIVDLLEKSDRYKNVFSDWSQPEYYSVVMQPFIISPMINVSDIAVSVKKIMPNFKDFNQDTNSFIDYAIFIAHPFPILERYDKKTNTQIFINMSDLNKGDEKYNYGYGPRACLGRLYAREFLKEFFEAIIKNNDKFSYMPEKLHLYSGRDNDNGSINESIYQLKSLSKIFYNLIMERISIKFKSINLD